MNKPRSLRELDAIDERLLHDMRDSFPLVANPFQELGARVGLEEEDAISRVRALRELGALRQVGSTHDTKGLGFSSLLVAMRVAPRQLAEAVHVVNAHPGVSHSYGRDHEFNLWLAITSPPGVDVRTHVDALHHLAGASSTRMLPALRLFKGGAAPEMLGDCRADDGSQPRAGANGIAVWAVPEGDVGHIGEVMAGYTAISDCYHCPTYEDWPYNVFTMLDARSKGECDALVKQFSTTYGLADYDVLHSTHEYKNIRLSYFAPEWDEWEERHMYSRRLAHAV